MENNIWKANMTALRKHYPKLCEYIEKKEYQDSEEWLHAEVSLEQAYTEEPISKVTIDGKSYYLAGKYSPSGMAERMAENYEKLDYGTVIFSVGLSDGRLLLEMEKLAEEKVIFVVYEPCLDIFIHTLEHYDLTVLLQRKEFIPIIDGISGEELKEVLEQTISVDNMLKIKPVIMGNYDVMFPQQTKQAVTALNKRIEQLRFHWNTMMLFEKETLVNSIENYKHLYKHYSINAIFDTLQEDVPVIVVAAGPSLDKNIDLLTKAKGKACIIACDTALKPLLRRNIVPDFFVVVDPRKPMELFEEPRIAQIPMISGLDIPVQLMEQHKGKKILCWDTLFMTELFQFVFKEKENEKEHAMSDLPSGGSVATSAFSAGRLMGAKTIILVGQDLALSGENEHAEGTFQKDRTRESLNQNLPLVEGIDGSKIPTLHNLKLYLEWFERQIEIYQDLKVVDATEGGALIHGTEVLTLQEAIDTYCTGSFDSEAYIEQLPLHFNDEQRKLALEFFAKIPKHFEKIRSQVKQGKTWYKKLEKCVQKPSYSNEEMQKITKRLKKVNKFLDSDLLSLLIMDGIKAEEYTVRTTVYQFQNDEKEDLLESARIGQRFLESFEKALKDIEPSVEKLSRFQGE